MPSASAPYTKQLPNTPSPETQLPPVRIPAGFSVLEWNALVNHAQAILQALRACQATGDEGQPCWNCPVATSDPEARQPDPQRTCRARFRYAHQRLAALSRQAPSSQRKQLRRTVDSLHLAYRAIDQQEEQG